MLYEVITVYPGDHDDEGAVRRYVEWLFERQQQIVQRIGECLLNAFRRLDPVAPGPLLEFLEQMVGRFESDVTGQQQRFQFRLTSYNVCYTKLLRFTPAMGNAFLLQIFF